MQTADFVSTLYDGRSNPNKVTVAFTMGVNALAQGHSSCIILMVEAVELGQPNATDGLAIGQPFQPVPELLKAYIDQGGRIAICASCMIHNGMSAEQMDPRFEIITAPQVIDLLMNAKGTLQVA